jgi:hypothetical protein
MLPKLAFRSVFASTLPVREPVRVRVGMHCRNAYLICRAATPPHTAHMCDWGFVSDCDFVGHLSNELHGCPCGYAGDTEKECTCSSTMIARYQKRLSGPLLDRIDIHAEVPRVPFQKLSDERREESSAAIRGRAAAARGRQGKRFAGSKLSCNTDMGPAQIKEYCHIDDAARSLLRARCGRYSSQGVPITAR